jgi:ABC-2 type transport system ATP-binding protein
LREIKRSFGRNAVALRIEGGDTSALQDSSLVAKVVPRSDEIEALLAADADVQELLRRLVAGGAQITKFELIEPSLHDIFVTKVDETDEQASGNHQA